MPKSRQIAGLLGPTMVAMLVSEFPLVQPHLYDAQIPPVVYLSGTLMFVAGLAIIRVHNHWARDWTLLVTLSGWFFLALGLFRMFAAGLYRQGSANASATVFMVLEGLLSIIGLFITFKAYTRDPAQQAPGENGVRQPNRRLLSTRPERFGRRDVCFT